MVCLLFSLFFLPFLLLRVIIKTIVGLVMLPVMLVIGCMAALVFVFFAVSMTLVVPLMPIAILACGVWLIVRLASRPAAI